MPHINDCFHWSSEENSRATREDEVSISTSQINSCTSKILETGRKMCFPAPRNPDRNAQGIFQVDNDLGARRKAANKSDFQLNSREPSTTYLGKGDTTAFPGGQKMPLFPTWNSCATKNTRGRLAWKLKAARFMSDLQKIWVKAVIPLCLPWDRASHSQLSHFPGTHPICVPQIAGPCIFNRHRHNPRALAASSLPWVAFAFLKSRVVLLQSLTTRKGWVLQFLQN